jgi:hypothetical protein
MNSKQRRRDTRRWRWRVDPSWQENVHYLDDIERYNAIWSWCRDNYGIDVRYCGWRDRDCGRYWEFDDSQKAMMFKLKWG